jgi:hypothetical protein
VPTGREPGVTIVSIIKNRVCFIVMDQSCVKFVLLLLLLLIFAVSSRHASGQSSEDSNKSNHTIVPHVENIRDNIQKRVMLTFDDLFAIHQQLLLHYVQLKTSHEWKQLQEKMSQLKRALPNCEIQVGRMQRGDKTNLLSGQYPFYETDWLIFYLQLRVRFLLQ